MSGPENPQETVGKEAITRAQKALLRIGDGKFGRSLQAFLKREISLAALEIRELRIPRRCRLRSAISEAGEKHILLLRWIDGDERWGISECGCWQEPFYTAEYLRGAIELIGSEIFPKLPRRGSIGGIFQGLAEIRGWKFTVAALLDAVCDLIRRNGGNDPVDDWPHDPLKEVAVGVVLGEFLDREAAISQVGKAITAGYRRIKLKLSARSDMSILKAVRKAFPDAPLGFDFNGSLRYRDGALLREVASLRPVVVEQPFPDDCLDWSAALREGMPGLRVCLDESVTSLGDLAAAHRLGALDEVNIKPGRVGGMIETLAMVDYCARTQLPAWIGGMFESGVGRTASARYAARLSPAAIHDLSPPLSYLEGDIVTPPLQMDGSGLIACDTGRPVKLDEGMMTEYTVRQTRLLKDSNSGETNSRPG